MHLETDSSAYIVANGWNADCTSESIHFYCCDPACEDCHDPVASMGPSATNSRRKLSDATACYDTIDSTTSYSCEIQATGFVQHTLYRRKKIISTNLEAADSSTATGTAAPDAKGTSSSSLTVAVVASASVGFVGLAAVATLVKKRRSSRSRQQQQEEAGEQAVTQAADEQQL
jgi:hypothetical protein